MQILDKENYKIYNNQTLLNNLEFIIKLEWGTEVSVFGYASIDYDEEDEIETVVFYQERIHDNDEGMDISVNKQLKQSIALLIEDNILNDTTKHFLDCTETTVDEGPFISEETEALAKESIQLNK